MTKRALTGKAALAGTGAGKVPGGRAEADARLLALEGKSRGRRPRLAEAAGKEAGAGRAEAGNV